jgi:aminopeptidase N
VTATTLAATLLTMSKKVIRLFEQFQPDRYELSLHPDRDNMTFTGSVTIHGKKVGRTSQRITFHQNGLRVTAATITKHDKSGEVTLPVSRIVNQNSFDEVRVHTSQKVFPGKYSVTLTFKGTITRQMDGIYPCNFTHNGKKKKLIATQFESHDARKAFPCIDEPEAKATFSLTLVTPASETVISNTPIMSQEPYGGSDKKASSLQQTTFETTPRMSTYLLAFAYGELGYTEGITKDGVTVRAYATPDNVEQTRHGLDVAVKALEFFGEYFGVPYPLPKLDMIALPDFSSGAMENWGLITYRETTMLADDTTSSIETKQLVALVICHELSHQWFGNLVTMKWWNDLWLNESFANLMEHRAVDALYPEWNIWEQFVNTETASAKRRDSLVDVQSIRVDVNHPDEISTLFDPSIVYAKGGSVLYMLLNFIGEAAFRAGLTAYFKKHAYGNTVADDLWQSLSDASHEDIGTFMAGWINRPGYPLVDIDWQPGEQSLAISQRRFLSDPDTKAASTDPWQVPLNATTELSSNLLTTAAATLTFIAPKPVAPIFNHDGMSYSLPHYTNPEHLKLLVTAIQDDAVDAIDRLLLLDNYTMLQRGGECSTTELLDLLGSYEHEENENVWSSLAGAIGEVRKLIEGDEPSEDKLNAIVAKLVMPSVNRLGWEDHEGDSAQVLRMRGLALSMAIGAKVSSVIDEARKRFAHFTKPSDLDATIRSVVYFAAARYGSQADYATLLALHNSIQNADERDELAAALTSVKQPAQYTELLGLLDTNTIRRQDLMHWFVWLLRNRYARTDAWEWMTSHWDWIEEELKGDKSYSFFARYAGIVFTRPNELDMFAAFFTPKQADIALSRDISLGIQEITSRVAWRARNEVAVTAWLQKS